VCARFAAACLSSNKDTIQMSTDLDGGLAVDDYVSTYSCTEGNRSEPWWFVDLGEEYTITAVQVTLPNVGGDECRPNYYRSGSI